MRFWSFEISFGRLKSYATAVLLCTFELPFSCGSSSPAVTGDFVYVGSLDGYVYCLKAATGEKVWKYQTAAYDDDRWVRSSPVVLDGLVYVAGRYILYCLKAAEGDTGSWPMFKYNAARTGAR